MCNFETAGQMDCFDFMVVSTRTKRLNGGETTRREPTTKRSRRVKFSGFVKLKERRGHALC